VPQAFLVRLLQVYNPQDHSVWCVPTYDDRRRGPSVWMRADRAVADDVARTCAGGGGVEQNVD